MSYCNLDKAFYDGVGKYDFPLVKSNHSSVAEIKCWLPFDLTTKYKMNVYRKDIGIHFFLHDRYFEGLWNQPNRYIDNFKKSGAVLMTDFSMFTDFPKPIQLYNKYRNHWLAKFYQERGINIISTLGWSDEESLEWCCDGYEKGGIFAVPMISVIRDEECNNYFYSGLETCIKKLEPEELIIFTKSDRVLKKRLWG